METTKIAKSLEVALLEWLFGKLAWLFEKLTNEKNVARIHSLLWSHKQHGLTMPDIAAQLGISRKQTQGLLLGEMAQNAIRCEVTSPKPTGEDAQINEDMGEYKVEHYFTILHLRPPQRRSFSAYAAVITCTLVVLLGFCASRYPLTISFIAPKPEPNAMTPPDHGEAIAFVDIQAKRFAEQLRELEQRATWLETEVVPTCRPVWQSGHTCYVKGRLLSNVDVDDELAKLYRQMKDIRRKID